MAKKQIPDAEEFVFTGNFVCVSIRGEVMRTAENTNTAETALSDSVLAAALTVTVFTRACVLIASLTLSDFSPSATAKPFRKLFKL